MKRTNEAIFKSILENGFIFKSDLQLLKNRSNKEGRDLFNYDLLDAVNSGYGIPLTSEQGKQGLTWLKKFIKRNGESDIYGHREIEIIENASPEDFTFRGFYNAGRGFIFFLPLYELNGMEYIPMSTPYIVG